MQLAIPNQDQLVVVEKSTKNTDSVTVQRKSIKLFAAESGSTVREVRSNGSYNAYVKQYGSVHTHLNDLARQHGLEFAKARIVRDKDGKVVKLTQEASIPDKGGIKQQLENEIERLRAEINAMQKAPVVDEVPTIES